MTANTWIYEELSAFPASVKDFKFEWNWHRWLIGGKMFAAICLSDSGEEIYLTLKLEPLEGDLLRQQYADIIPGYYMNKVHWNSVKADGKVPDDILRDLLNKAYEIVLGSFSKKKQKEISGKD